MSTVTVRVLSWNGIPAQLKVVPTEGRTASRQLSDRWMQEIDRIAMREGLIESGAYLDGWEWQIEGTRTGDPETVADAVAAELEAQWATRPSRRGPGSGDDDDHLDESGGTS